MSDIKSERAMAVLRIQSKDDYAIVCGNKTYEVRLRESSLYRRYMVKKVGKKVGTANIVAGHLEADNRGYPDNNYKTNR